jgi:hypothetical protein
MTEAPSADALRENLRARLAQQENANQTGEIRINDDSTRTRAVTYNPAEHSGAPAGHPLNGATDPQGNPLTMAQAEVADPRTVIVTYMGHPMRLSTAAELGLVRLEGGKVLDAAAKPAPQRATDQKQQPEGGDKQQQGDTDSEEEAERKAAEKLAGNVFDEGQQQDLALADDALARAGFQPDAAIANIVETGEIAPQALAALVAASGGTEESVLGWIADMGHTIEEALVEAMGGGEAREFIKHVQENEPEAWNRAALASVRAGTPLPLLRVIAQRAEDERAWGGGTW